MIKPNAVNISLELRADAGIKNIECLGPAITDTSESKIYTIFQESITLSKFDTSNCPKIFISKSCKIPRAKLGSLKDNKVLEVKRNIKDCEYLVINTKSIVSNNLEFDYNSFIIDISELHNIIKFELTHRVYEQTVADNIKGTFAEVLNYCKMYGITKVRLHRVGYETRTMLLYTSRKEIYYDTLQPKGYTKQSFMKDFDFLNHPDRKYDTKGELDDYDSAYNLVSFSSPEIQALLTSNIKVIDSSEVTKLINSTVIDEELFGSISSMLSSDDYSNIDTALEIMASCDFEESMFYIVMLLDLYYHTISNSNYFKHVNFQSLIQHVKSVLSVGDIDTPHRFRRVMGGQSITEGHAYELLEKGYMFPEHMSFIKQNIFPNHNVECSFIKTEFHVPEEVIRKMHKNLEAKQDNTEE